MSGLVHIVDDDPSFLAAMERHLKHAGYQVAAYSSAQELLDRLPSDGIPGCILLDVQMPDLDGSALQRKLVELGSALPIIFLSGHTDIPLTVRAIKAGARDFLSKPASSEDLFRAIAGALAHHQSTLDLQNKISAARARLATLTPRERQVFNFIVRGKINKQIAHALGTTEFVQRTSSRWPAHY
jgi:FixJ family two-component response regulator